MLTVGAVFALYFASSGVESLRIGLNRAYEQTEERAWWLLRLEIDRLRAGRRGGDPGVCVSGRAGAVDLVEAPDLRADFEPLSDTVTFTRYAVVVVVLMIALAILHRWLPAGHRRFTDIAPGIVATLVLWLISGATFGRYLASYAFAYVSMYAGLASAMVALIFLYVCASIFIYGGELNAVIVQRRKKPHR